MDASHKEVVLTLLRAFEEEQRAGPVFPISFVRVPCGDLEPWVSNDQLVGYMVDGDKEQRA